MFDDLSIQKWAEKHVVPFTHWPKVYVGRAPPRRGGLAGVLLRVGPLNLRTLNRAGCVLSV